jgi:hypothetical protein
MLSDKEYLDMGASLGPWHRWFAWKPVFTCLGWKWLTHVERRWTFKDWLHPAIMGSWDYRPYVPNTLERA